MSYLLATEMVPFMLALGLVAGLLVLELIAGLAGSSLLGDAGDLDGLEANDGFDVGGPGFVDGDGAELDVGAGGASAVDAFAASDGAAAAANAETGAAPGAESGAEADADFGAGLLAWLGFGKVPVILWLAGFLTAFGAVGTALQGIALGVFGTLLPALLAVTLAAIPALRIGRWFARTLGRLVPKTETTAIARRSLGDRRGVVVQGLARRGRPAQARVRDGHGNFHYVRIEPVDDGIDIPQGTEVLIRAGRGPVLLAIPID